MIDFKSIAHSVSQVAPLLGSVITESNPIAGLIIMAICKLFNCNANASDLLNAISADPSAVTKLKQLELEHEDVLMQNQVEDRMNARSREEKIIELTGKRDWVLDFIGLSVILGFFMLCLLSYFVDLKDDHIVIMLIGQISSGFMLCLSYYFGSSNK